MPSYIQRVCTYYTNPGYINKTYNECSRSAILRKYFSLKKVVRNYEYWMLARIYFTVSLIALYFSQTYFFLSAISVGIAALCIYPFLELKLSKDLVNTMSRID